MSSSAHLATLPKELLTNIALNLDQRSASAFSLTARAFTEPALHRIWRDIDLSLHPHHGEYPLVRPLSYRDEGYCDWAQGEAKRAEDRHRVAVTERVHQGLQVGNAKLAMIKTLKVVPRVGANSSIVVFLDMIASSLTELELQAPQKHVFQKVWHTPTELAHHSLWFKMLDFDVVGRRFTALTHLTLGKGAVDRQNAVLHFCLLAPQLQYLDVTFDPRSDELYDWGNDDEVHHSEVEPPCWPSNPSLDCAELSLRVIRIKDGVDPDGVTCTETAIQLLQHCKALESLEWLNYDNPRVSDCSDDWMSLARANTELKSLRCTFMPSTFEDEDAGDILFPDLRRLSGRPVEHLYVNHIEFLKLPAHPTVQVVRFVIPKSTYDAPTPNTVSTLFPDARSTKLIPPGVVATLADCPQLRHVEMTPKAACAGDYAISPFCPTKWGEHKISGSIIRSFHHAGETLHHIRTLTSHRRGSTEVVDIALNKSLHDTAKARYAYEVRDEAAGIKKLVWFFRAKVKEWEDATEYNGMSVPLKVIRDTRLAENAASHKWEKRGVQVGEKGWKVLKQWAEKQPGWAAKTQAQTTAALDLAAGHSAIITDTDGDNTTVDAAGVDGANNTDAMATTAPAADATATASTAPAPASPNDSDTSFDLGNGPEGMSDEDSEADNQF